MGGLAVRGTCKRCGYTVTTVAVKPKLTWKGPCPNPGCGAVITAHRIRDPEQAAAALDEPPAAPAPQPAGKPARKKLIRVGYLDPELVPLEPKPRPDETPGAPPGLQPAPADAPPGRAAGGRDDHRPEPRRRIPRAGSERRGITPYDELY